MPSRNREGQHQVSLVRAISKLGLASRSQALALIKQGRVRVDEEVVRSPGVWVDLKKEHITLDGEATADKPKIYLAFHKPAGIVTTRSDERGRRTIYALLPPDLPWVFPVGRLDKDTSGLLLLTNDTRFGEQVTNPLQEVPKTYAVRLATSLVPSDIKKLESPMTLRDGTVLKPARVHALSADGTECNITITEGKNRQLRKMFRQLGHDVEALKRLGIGSIQLGALREGECRALTRHERTSIITSRSVANHESNA